MQNFVWQDLHLKARSWIVFADISLGVLENQGMENL